MKESHTGATCHGKIVDTTFFLSLVLYRGLDTENVSWQIWQGVKVDDDARKQFDMR